MRHWGLDIGVLTAAAAAGIWWASGPGGLDLGLADDDSADNATRTLLAHHVTRYYPTFLGLLLCILLLRVGRRNTDGRRTNLPGAVYASLTAGQVLVIAALPATDALFVPGSAVQRLVPCLAGALLACAARLAMYGSLRRHAATDAGFLPPSGVLWRPRTHRAVRRCTALALGTQAAADKARASFEAAREAFARHGSSSGLTWCLAAEVDYHLHVNALDHAEKLLEGAVAETPQGQPVPLDPAVVAAQALFLQAVGDGREALARFTAAADALRAAGRRIPARLSTLQAAARALDTDHQQSGGVEPDDGAGIMQFTRLVWFRQPSLVLRYLLERTRKLARTDPEAALRVVDRMIRLGGHLSQPFYFSDLTAEESSHLVRARAQCYELSAEINAGLRRGDDAVHGYLEAARLYGGRRYRAPQGVALVRAALAALATAPRSAGRESQQLDLLLRGLRMLEYDRGLLRAQRYRFALVGDRDRLYSDVFAGLSADVRKEKRRAAEIALWLMESLHRSATSATIRRGLDTASAPELRRLRSRYEQLEAGSLQQADGVAEAPGEARSDKERGHLGAGAGSGRDWARLREDIAAEFSERLADALVPEPVDLSDIAGRLAGRLALYYRCERGHDGWCVTTVALLPDGPHLYRSTLPIPRPGDHDDSFRLNPALLLDQLHGGDEAAVARIHRTTVLHAQVWETLAHALLPQPFQAHLQSAATGARPTSVVIIPDGPLSAVPFAGLPLNDGATFAERAVAVFMPNLDMLAQHAGPQPGVSDPTRILVNIGQPGFADAFARARAEDTRTGRLVVAPTANREEFVSGLSSLQRDDVALVFNHGLLSTATVDQHVQMNDGRILSTTTAWNLAWPRTVILGSCWSSNLALSTSQEPLAMATACLLGGAEHVLGAQAPAYTKQTGQLLAEVTVSTAHGDHPALALREAALTLRAAGHVRPLPADWANLVVWTTQPPAAGAGEHLDARRWWTARGLAVERATALFGSEPVPPTGELVRALPTTDPERDGITTSTTLRSALKWARSTYGDVPFTSMEFLTAVLATDTDDWAAFLRSAGLGSPPEPSAADDGNSSEGTSLTWRDGATAALNVPLAQAMRIGQRFHFARGDTKLEPSHLVYGLIEHQANAVAKWLTSGSASTPARLRDLLAEQIFPRSVPASESLPQLPKGPTAAYEPVPVGLFRVRRGLTIDGDLQRVAEEGIARSDGGVLTTLTFVRAALRHDASLAKDLGIPAGADPLPGPTDGREPAGRSGRGLLLSADLTITASANLIRATELAQRLCLHQGTERLMTRHLVAALFAVEESEGARLLRDSSSPSTIASYSDAVRVLFPTAPVEDPLGKAPREDIVFGPVLDILAMLAMGLGLGLRWCALKAGRFALGFCILLVPGITAALHSTGTAHANADLLSQQASTIEGTVHTPDGSGHPAVLVGPLSAFYHPPVVKGLANAAKGALRDKTPDSLDDWYVFGIPADRSGALHSGTVMLNYKGRTTKASLHCDGIDSVFFCLAEARLKGAGSPGGFRWQNATISLSPHHPTAAALVLQRSGPQLAVDAATVRLRKVPAQYADSGLLTVTDDNGYPVTGLEPIVLNGKSHLLPLLGFAQTAPARTRANVVPYNLLAAYATGLAEDRAGSVPGAVAAAEVTVTQHAMAAGPSVLTLDPTIGGPADVSGVHPDDVVVSVDGRAVTSASAFAAVVRSHEPGDMLPLTISRSGRLVRLNVRLGYLTV
ncbi:CHAT domain-containing protein [Streptomyces sp. R08]|uniref:CHAT domain-containing protein n=1 Tax=Streptomyces sp. R08 TaxID=3238624 RepID=A0AB39MMM4_9ACTN